MFFFLYELETNLLHVLVFNMSFHIFSFELGVEGSWADMQQVET